MDKYEYNQKSEELKSLCAEGKYEEAAELADAINWNKVRNVNALVKAGEIYEKVGRYDDSRDILLDAYDRSPIGRTIIYRLAEVSIKMGDLVGAQGYYQEFVDIAPHDNQRYVLKYDILRAMKEPLEQLIPVLEEFKEQEYTEEWAYELAQLYHQTGAIDKCIDACDELILWFGDGPYVERALELKMLYQPLTKVQEEKYRRFCHEKEGKTVIGAEEMERAGEYGHDMVAIPQITLNPSRFNTTNLQEEIAKGMQQIMEATEKETVVGTMDNIKKIVEEIPYLQMPREEVLPVREDVHIETDEEIDGSLKINFQELLGEESDGQISLVMNERAQLEKQITGQMTIAEVLEEWEKTRIAAETALRDAEHRKLESAKARALQQAEDIMERLNDVLPKIEAGVSPREIFEEGYIEDANAILEKEINRLNVENKILEQKIELGKTKKFSTQDLSELRNIIVDAEQEEAPTAIIEQIDDIEVEPKVEEAEEVLLPEIMEPESLFELDDAQDVKEEPKEDLEHASKVADICQLSEEQKAIFSYFVPVKGMEAQLCKALTALSKNLVEGTSATGNLIVQGSAGCGKTMLATSIVKVLQRQCGKPNGKIGKIYGEVLNKKDLQQMLQKVAGGAIIIESAGNLDRQTAVALSLLLEQDTSGILVILEDTAAGIKKALSLDEGFAKRFTEVVNVPLFSNDDFVIFAKAYANEKGYVIDEMAILALHNRITNIEKLDQATRLEEIKDIIDDAIHKETHSGLRKAFGILTASRYTDDEKIVLREKDFE